MPLPGPHELNELHAAIRACTLCLEAGYTIVPCGIVCGRIGARVMVIGQAPGITEVEARRPFNVRSGKWLFAWLSQAGFDEATFRAAQYMTAPGFVFFLGAIFST